jgi:type II secretory pathway component GspD/PulD (secretin)
MMRWMVFLLCWPAAVYAAPISFNFNDVSLLAFCQSTYRNLLHVNFVIAPDVLAMDRKITLSVADLDDSKVGPFVDGILKQQGIAVDVRDGVYYLVPAAKGAPVDALADVSRDQSSTPAPVVSHAQGSALERSGEVEVMRRTKDDESEFYQAVNRPADFLVAVVNGAFGRRSAVAVGSGVVLTGSHDDVDKMHKLLDAVDSMPKLVDVSASWIEVTNSTSDGRGISLLANVLGARLGASVGTVNSGSALSFKSSSFELVIDALKSDGRFKQVSNSRLVGDDYEKLVLTVGDETPTISSTGKDNAGNTVQNVVYRPSGVIVDVQPKVLGNGRIQLLVDGQISNFKSTATGVVGSPTLVKRQVKTKVTVADGEVLLIGGLNDEQAAGSSSALSFMPWFGGRTSTTSRTDLVLVLSAKVVKQ